MTVIQMPEPHRDLASEIEVLPGLLTIAQLIPLVGISRTTIYQMVTTKRIPHLRIGSMVRFDPHAIAAWLRQHAVAA
jgi:excisionase family DNA binding protein